MQRPAATSVAFSRWTKRGFSYRHDDVSARFLSFPLRQRMSKALDWKSVQFEQDTSSRYSPCPGNQPSRSNFMTACSGDESQM